jgi:hypothetical protein
MKLPRSRALVVAGLAGVTTLMAGSAVLVAGAQAGSGSVLPVSRTSTDATTVVTEVQYDDTYTVVMPDSAHADGSAGSEGVDSTTDRTVTDSSAVPATDPATDPADDHQADGPTTEATTEPEHGHDSGPPVTTPTTTVVTPPTTESHDGHDGSPEVDGPDDGATGQPAPPVPVGCVHPELEDDGHWNCDH